MHKMLQRILVFLSYININQNLKICKYIVSYI